MVRFYYIQDSLYLKLRERKPTDGIDSILVDFEELERFRAKQHEQNSVSTIWSIPVKLLIPFIQLNFKVPMII